jgi:hypothetical protein
VLTGYQGSRCQHATVSGPCPHVTHVPSPAQPLADAPTGEEDSINPEARANLLSLATFSWMSALMRKVAWRPPQLAVGRELQQCFECRRREGIR